MERSGLPGANLKKYQILKNFPLKKTPENTKPKFARRAGEKFFVFFSHFQANLS